jgi:Amt family ammonium transporter
MITGLVAITPSAGYVNGYGAVIIGVVASTIVWMSIRFLSRTALFRKVDDTLGVVYTHGIAGLSGGLLVGVLADPHMILYPGVGKTPSVAPMAGLIHGNWTLIKWQALAALTIIVWDGVMTFVILKVISIFVPLRHSDEELEIGDHAIHANEVYPSDVPSLGSHPIASPA